MRNEEGVEMDGEVGEYRDSRSDGCRGFGRVGNLGFSSVFKGWEKVLIGFKERLSSPRQVMCNLYPISAK